MAMFMNLIQPEVVDEDQFNDDSIKPTVVEANDDDGSDTTEFRAAPCDEETAPTAPTLLVSEDLGHKFLENITDVSTEAALLKGCPSNSVAGKNIAVLTSLKEICKEPEATAFVVVKSNTQFLWGCLSVPKITTKIFDETHISTAVVFRNQKQGLLPKKFGCKGVGREVHYEDDYPWDPGIT